MSDSSDSHGFDGALLPTGAARLAGVVGWPVRYSLSPLLHSAWLRALNVNGVYAPFAVAPDDFAMAMNAWAGMGVVGVNVTQPHKDAAFAGADELTENARRIGAVNLLVHGGGGRWRGDNTDVVGVAAALSRVPGGCCVTTENRAGAGRAAVVFGAGGAARATVWAILDCGWSSVFVVNRTLEKAQTLVGLIGPDGDADVQAVAWEERHEVLAQAGLVANATDCGMQGRPALDVDLAVMPVNGVVFDAVYNPQNTPLLRDAARYGHGIVPGLAMLIEQARPSFSAFYGAQPPSDDVIDAYGLMTAALAGDGG